MIPYDIHPPTVIEAPMMDAKTKALVAMRELQGWCSEEKAIVLIDLIINTKPSTVVEIGVFGGKSLVPMAFALQHNGFGKIYGIDPWTAKASVEGMEEANRIWWSQINHDKILADLVVKIQKYGLQKQIELIRKTSEEAPAIAQIDVLHLDGNHSEKSSCFDLEKWVPLVKEGGYIIFDDIYWCTTGKAVAWLDQNYTRILDSKEACGWGIWVKDR